MTHKWKYWDTFNPDEWFGFIYKITNLESGRFYIGKKVFKYNKKHKLTKTQLSEQTGRGRRSTHETIQVESDWKTYWGSNKELQADVKTLGKDKFECLILKLCKTKKQLTYWEIHHQCVNECIVSPRFTYNDNILGKFFSKDLVD
jgi:hypothetical protein